MQRALGLGLVALLHLALLLTVLQNLVTPVSRVRIAHELTLILPQLPKAKPQVRAGVPTAPARPRPTPPALPHYETPVMPPDPLSRPDVQSLGQALFGCSPNRRAEMTEDERAHCPQQFAMPDPSEMREPPSEVKDLPRREAELAAKNTPLRIPCVAVMNAPAPYGGTQAIPGVNPFCVAHGLLNGFGPLSGLAH